MSILADDPLLLPRLLIGFEALRERHAQRMFYPYPETLQIAWNALSARQLMLGHRPPPQLRPSVPRTRQVARRKARRVQ